VAEFLTPRALARHRPLQTLGPDLLSPTFDRAEALRRIRERPGDAIADALLNQRVLAGIGNVFKCEVLFLGGVHPFTRVADVDGSALERLIDIAREQLT